jgi:hypothetical protein
MPGKGFYGSNRGHDSLARFQIGKSARDLTVLGHRPTEKTPRSFDLDPDGRFLFAAGEASGKLAAYRVDATTGDLTRLATYDVGKMSWWFALEQPLPANRLDGFRRLKHQGALPILMDEGIVSRVELEEFLLLGLLDGVTMKVARSGGLLEACRVLELVQQAGLLFLGNGQTDPDLSLAASLTLFAAFDLDLSHGGLVARGLPSWKRLVLEWSMPRSIPKP